MRITKNKTAAIAIAMFLMLSMSASMILIPTATAHTPAWQITTHAYIFVAPNPIGVGQATLIYMWLDKVPDGAMIGNDVRFHNYHLTITRPDNTTETKTWDVIYDSTSSQGYSYTPDKVGTYTLNFTFPGQTYTWTQPVGGLFGPPAPSDYVNDTYLASTASTTLTVQEEPVLTISSPPLPTEYWTRPIYGENTAWWSISSNWLGTGAANYGGFGVSYNLGGNGEAVYPGDAVGPQTAHVMWTKPLQSGGVVGGNNFAIQGDTYFEGSAYNQRFSNPIIVNGRLYYTEPVSFTGVSSGPTDCVDLRTGELIWSRTDVPALSFAYIYNVQDPNQHGVYPAILFTSNFARAFDADTGNPLFNVTTGTTPSGAISSGPQGEQLRYVLANAGNTTNPDWRLGEWNSSKLWTWTGLSPAIDTSTTTTYALVNTTTYVNNVKTITSVNVSTTTTAVNASIFDLSSSHNRYDWNILIPWRNTMSLTPTVVAAYYNDVMLCYNGSLPSTGSTFMGSASSAPYTYFAVNLNPTKGAVGSILWMKTYDPPAGNVTVLEGGVDTVNRVFLENYRETMQWVGYSLDTGQKLWGPTASQTALDYYGSPASGSLSDALAYGKLYSSAYGGILYCYDTKTGDLLWTYGNGGTGNSTNSGFEVPGPYPTFVNAIGNGVVYTVTTEHTVETPIYKGALVRAINATDGKEIWTLSDYTGEFTAMSFAIADGFATFFNGYDNQIYSVGRGPSATTVQAPLTAITAGNKVVIQGTVTDISAGTTQNQQAADFPNGVPAVSDASMGDWMGYVYQQKPLPTNTTGVKVSIDAIDPNGNYIHLGNATTNGNGLFRYTWMAPNIPGDYLVTATFAGTNGYWPSNAQTGMTVQEAPTVTPTATPQSNLATTTELMTYMVAGVIAIIIAIAIVGLLILRKRPVLQP